MDIHLQIRKIGNSWGLIIPKEIAEKMGVTEKTMIHANLRILPKISELRGTVTTKNSTEPIMKEIDEGWE